MALENLDGETQSKPTSTVKGTIWQASLKHLKDQILENISFNLKLKAAKKSQKITDAYLFKQTERQQWLMFSEQISAMIPESPLKAANLEGQKNRIANIDKELAGIAL